MKESKEFFSIPDSIWDMANFRTIPKFPKITLKKNNAKYEIVNLAFLNQEAVDIWLQVLNTAVNTPDVEKVEIDTSGMGINADVITDILFGIDTFNRETDKSSFSTTLLISGITHKEDTCLEIELRKDHTKIFYEQITANIEYHELVVTILDAMYEEMEKELKNSRKKRRKNDTLRNRSSNT